MSAWSSAGVNYLNMSSTADLRCIGDGGDEVSFECLAGVVRAESAGAIGDRETGEADLECSPHNNTACNCGTVSERTG